MPGSFVRVLWDQDILPDDINKLQEAIELIEHTGIPAGGTPADELVMVEGIAAWRPRVQLDIRDFGAVASGAAPSQSVMDATTSAVLEALSKLPAARGGIVRVPGANGDYWINGDIPLASGQFIVGDGPRASRLRVADPSADGITITGTQDPDTSKITTIVQAGVRDLALIGPSSGTGIGLKIKWASYGISSHNLHLFGWGSHGAQQEDTYSVSWRECAFDMNGGDGFHGFTNVNQTLFERCIAVFNGGAGYQIIGGAGNILSTCDAEVNGTYGIDLRYCFSTKILGGDLEENELANIYLHWRGGAGEKAQTVSIEGVNITGGGVTPIGLLIDGADAVHYADNYFSNHTLHHVQTTANASRPWPGPNRFDASATELQDGSLTTFGVDRDESRLAVRTRGKHYVTGALEVDGALDHDGSTFGLCGVAPSPRAALAPNATDLASAITLVNDIKAKLAAKGITL